MASVRLSQVGLLSLLVNSVLIILLLGAPSFVHSAQTLNLDGAMTADDPNRDPNWDPTVPGAVQTLSLNRAMTADDPNRDPNWDWTLNQPYHLYVVCGAQIAVCTHPNVQLPYYSNVGPAGELYIPGDQDIRWEEGWVLLYRDFGTPDRGATMPLYILYNRFRGILRLFYFNTLTPETFTHSKVTLKFSNPAQAAALLSFEGQHVYLDNFDQEKALVTISEIAPFQWSYADFVVLGFDDRTTSDNPDDPLSNSTLTFEITGIRRSDITLSGELTLDQVLADGSVTGAKKGVDVLGAFMDAYKTFKSIEGVRTDLQKKVKENPNEWYVPIVSDLLSFSPVKFAGGIGVVASLIKSFIGGKENRAVPMHFQGKIALSGQSTTETSVFRLDLRLPGSPHTDPTDSAIPFYDRPLGVFNLTTRPTVKVHCDPIGIGPGCIMHFTLKEPLTGVVNDFSDVAQVTVEAGYVFPRGQTAYSSLDEFAMLRQSHLIVYPNGIALKVTVQPLQAEEPPIVIIKTYQPKVENWNLSVGGSGPVMNSPVATLFPEPYGPGMALSWTPTAISGAAYYEVQFSEHESTTFPAWQTYTSSREVFNGSGIDHAGNLACGASFTGCLKSSQRYSYRVRVLDSAEAPVSDWSNVVSATSLDWAALPSPHPPTISAPSFLTLPWQQGPLTFAVTASDVDGDQVEIQATGLPAGATLSPTSGTDSVTATFTWQPGPADIGEHRVTFLARDGRGSTSAPAVTIITVTSLPPLSVRINGPRAVTVKGTYTFAAELSGFRSPTFTWSERFCDDAAGASCSAWVTIHGLGSSFRRTLGPDCTGTGERTFQLRVLVVDFDGREATDETVTALCGGAL